MSRPFAILIVSTVALTWAVYLFASGIELSWAFLGPFSAAVGVLTIMSFVFQHWVWHWPGLHYLTKTPRLTGTWLGTLESNYVNIGESEPRAAIPVAVVITQTVDSINVRQYTQESFSTTVTASVFGEPGERFLLSTVYLNEPKIELQQTRSAMHYGATRLLIHGPPRNPTTLSGTYWTPRNTSGSLELRFLTRKRAHSFQEAFRFRSAETPGDRGNGGVDARPSNPSNREEEEQ